MVLNLKLFTFVSASFYGSDSLYGVILGNNFIRTLPSHTFSNLFNLNEISLSDNVITTIETGKPRIIWVNKKIYLTINILFMLTF